MTPPAQNPFSRRQFGALTAAGLAAAAVPPALAGPAAAATPGEPYQPTWPSVDRHPPAPEWFQDTGNRVQFAPKPVSRGGRFDPGEWARVVKASGACLTGLRTP